MSDDRDSVRGLQVRAVRGRFTLVFCGWVLGSVGVGAVLWFGLGGAFWGSAGSQFVIWGGINAVFALMGVRQGARARRGLEDDVGEGRKLLGALRVSHWMNYGWVSMGIALGVWAAAEGSAALWGHCMGVLVQAGFLFVNDRVFENAVRGALEEG